MAHEAHAGPLTRLLGPGIDRLRFLAACASYLGAFVSLQLTGRVPGIWGRLRTLIGRLRTLTGRLRRLVGLYRR